MNTNSILLKRVEYLIDLANKSLETKYTTQDSLFTHHWVSRLSFNEFDTASLSFILNLLGYALITYS